VLENEAMFAPVVAICAQPAVALLRSILNPDSLLEVSAQVRLIWLKETAVAVRLVGAAGTPVRAAPWVTHALVFEYAELP
jgi:hypothetical protein